MTAADQAGSTPEIDGRSNDRAAAGDARAPREALRTDPKLLEMLICPVSRTRLEYDASRQELISRAAGLAYPIRNGVPMMTAAAARTLDESEVAAGHRRP